MIAIFCGFAAMARRARFASDSAASTSLCCNNFKWVTLALHNYHETNGTFPPAYLTDAHGKPTPSWRVLILPYIEHGSLFNEFHLSEPWDSPHNIKLLNRMPPQFGCPSLPPKVGHTSCVAITGPGTFFPGATCTSYSDATDGLEQTILNAEIRDSGIPWTASAVLDVRTMSLRVNVRANKGISGPHADGPFVSLANGSVHRLPDTVSPAALRGMVTISGGDTIDASAELR